MIKIFSYGRKVRVPLDEKGYNSNEYNLFATVQYDEKDLEELTIIDKNEFKELAKEIDEIQREIILEETGIKELPMDISRKRNKPKMKKKKKDNEEEYEEILPKTGLDKLKWKLKNRKKM